MTHQWDYFTYRSRSQGDVECWAIKSLGWWAWVVPFGQHGWGVWVPDSVLLRAPKVWVWLGLYPDAQTGRRAAERAIGRRLRRVDT